MALILCNHEARKRGDKNRIIPKVARGLTLVRKRVIAGPFNAVKLPARMKIRKNRGSNMIRLQALALCAAVALLSACATPVSPPADAPSSPPKQARAPSGHLPKIEWTTERSRISRALSGASDLSVIERNDGSLQLLIPGAEAFARDGVEPRPGLRTTLDRIAAALAERPETEILVLGHTDAAGSELHNMQLSIRRAEAVAEYLRARGIALTRLHADGRGETEPFADNGSEAGRAKNRRVEIVVRPFGR